MSVEQDPVRPGEVIVTLPGRTDANVIFIGRLRTPFATRAECPRQGNFSGPLCRVEVETPFAEGLDGLERYRHVEVIYWMHQARRDLIRQSPKANGLTTGTFSLRSPLRPNPIATSVCLLVGREPGVLLVRGLDCLDGTPLLDIKPHRGEFTPQAVARSGIEPPGVGSSQSEGPWCASAADK